MLLWLWRYSTNYQHRRSQTTVNSLYTIVNLIRATYCLCYDATPWLFGVIHPLISFPSTSYQWMSRKAQQKPDLPKLTHRFVLITQPGKDVAFSSLKLPEQIFNQ